VRSSVRENVRILTNGVSTTFQHAVLAVILPWRDDDRLTCLRYGGQSWKLRLFRLIAALAFTQTNAEANSEL